MIIFKQLRYKNFLSTGNSFTEVQLDRHTATLVVGQNGAGKSTMLDAISFALFGSPHRNISKKQLINSINNKDCVVEVEFGIGSHEFKIVRSIKPNNFEIWQNGKMINQSSTVRDYQKYLEQNILKLNHKSFHQIVVLGSSSFIPFMQLKSKDRREVIEDLLDINIFSKMNQLLKEKIAKNNEESKFIDYEINTIQNNIEYQKKYIQDISSLNEDQKTRMIEQIQLAESEITELEFKNDGLLTDIENIQKPAENKQKKLTEQQNQLKTYDTQFKSKITNLVKDAKFYAENDNCPICSQAITPELKASKLSENESKAKEIQKTITELDVKMNEINAQLSVVFEDIKKVQEKSSIVMANNREIQTFQKQIETLNKDVLSLSKTGDLSEANQKMRELFASSEMYSNKKAELAITTSYDRVAQELLKDTGIKTKIVKEYIPVINKLVNNYLQILDFFVLFNLDENFNETIKSRHRDDFGYDSFSEGEKQRIDLSLMFTWRQISKMKNSTSTNLLILDETFDSSLDETGIENLLKIIKTLGDDTNVFIISHKGDILEDKFPNKIEFIKEKNFSKIKEK